MIKLIISDMDGTLLDENSHLSEEFFDVFKELKKKDILFVAASGRQYYTLRNNFAEVKEDIAYVAENGSYLVHNGNELLSHTVDHATIKELIRVGRQTKGFEMILCGKKAAYTESKAKGIKAELDRYYHRHEIVEDLELVKDDFFKLAACSLEGEAEKFNEIFYPAWGNRLKVTVSGKMWIDFNKSNVNKGIAIKFLQEKYNIKPEETMAFGDYFNDIEMLRSAYYSYAMGNAPDEVKNAARFIAKSNTENGVLEVIKEMLLK